MQFFLQDLRNLGYKKIVSNYDSMDSILTIVSTESLKLSRTCSAYSLPRRWGSTLISSNNYHSMKLFMNMCEPMIEDIKVDKIVQRKFRNKWSAMWGSISNAFNLNSYAEDLLKSFGINLCFINNVDINDVVLSFYNDIILWYLFTQSESNFEMVSLTPLSLLELMVVNDEVTFMAYIGSRFK